MVQVQVQVQRCGRRPWGLVPTVVGAVLATLVSGAVLGACDGVVGRARPLSAVAPGVVTTPEPRMTRTDPLRIVVVGDSVTLPVPDCVPAAPRRVAPCVGVEQALARDLGDRTGRPVVRDNLSLSGGDVDGVLLGLTSDEREKVVGAADLVVVSVGMQSQDGWLDTPCPGGGKTPPKDGIEALTRVTPACVDAFVAGYRSRLVRLYSTIQRLVADHAAVLVDLGVFNDLVGHPDLGPEPLPPRVRLALERSLEITERWATADCAIARAHGFVCADLRHAFNGPDGRQPTSDYVHWFAGHPRLTQAGVLAVTRLVESLDLSLLL